MRYPKEYKASARQHLVDAGGSHAKKHGFGESGMADLAAAAGVTTGSLYKHFDGKADLFAALISAELKRTAQMYGAIESQNDESVAKSLATYLSLQHVQHPETGCPLPSLTAEVARADDSVREAFQEGVRDIHAIVKKITGSADKAWALIAQNVGAVMLARALPNERTQRELLTALRLAGERLLQDESFRSSVVKKSI